MSHSAFKLRPNLKSVPVACIAPPLTDELLDHYETLAIAAEPEVREAIGVCLACVRRWWNLPDSGPVGVKPHSVSITQLDENIAQQLDDLIPWKKDIKALSELFDTLDVNTHRDLRNAAYHLLWHVIELDNGREPITQDLVMVPAY